MNCPICGHDGLEIIENPYVPGKVFEIHCINKRRPRCKIEFGTKVFSAVANAYEKLKPLYESEQKALADLTEYRYQISVVAQEYQAELNRYANSDW